MCVLLEDPVAVSTNLEIFAIIEIFFLDFILSGRLSSGMGTVGVGIGLKIFLGVYINPFSFSSHYYMWFYTYLYFVLFQKWI